MRTTGLAMPGVGQGSANLIGVYKWVSTYDLGCFSQKATGSLQCAMVVKLDTRRMYTISSVFWKRRANSQQTPPHTPRRPPSAAGLDLWLHIPRRGKSTRLTFYIRLRPSAMPFASKTSRSRRWQIRRMRPREQTSRQQRTRHREYQPHALAGLREQC